MAKKAPFTISIDDGFGEYSYKVWLSENLSIDDIIKKACKALKVEKPESHLRKEGESA
jgi:hypothetical protein